MPLDTHRDRGLGHGRAALRLRRRRQPRHARQHDRRLRGGAGGARRSLRELAAKELGWPATSCRSRRRDAAQRPRRGDRAGRTCCGARARRSRAAGTREEGRPASTHITIFVAQVAEVDGRRRDRRGEAAEAHDRARRRPVVNPIGHQGQINGGVDAGHRLRDDGRAAGRRRAASPLCPSATTRCRPSGTSRR